MNKIYLCEIDHLHWSLDTKDDRFVSRKEGRSYDDEVEINNLYLSNPPQEYMPLFLALCAFAQAKGLIKSTNHYTKVLS